MVSTPLNHSLIAEIESKAKTKDNFGINDPDQNYRCAMNMKIHLDTELKNNQRPAKDLAILYKRLIYTVDRTVGPMLRSL